MNFKRKSPKKLPRQTHTPRTHHSHPQTDAQWEYVGFSKTALSYHLWRCIAQPGAPANPRVVKPFISSLFSPASKAGKGGCSMRWCPGDAVVMDAEDKKQSRAYCETHKDKLTLSYKECSETIILSCTLALKRDYAEGVQEIQPCPVCKAK